jgi:hypothetical protein
MSTLEIILSVFGFLLSVCCFAFNHLCKKWQSIAQKLKEDFDKASDDLQSDRLENETLTRIAKYNSLAYKKQSERMFVIVAENQKLRRSNAQLISHRGLKGKGES